MGRRGALRSALLRLVLAASVALGLCTSAPASAEPSTSQSGAAPDEPASRMRLRFVLPLWLPLLTFEGSTQSKGTLSDVVQTETAVRWVAMGMLELGYRPIIARGDVFGIGFGDKLLRRDGQPSDSTVNSSALMTRGFLMYEFGPYRLSQRHADRRFSWGPIAGVRYNRIAVDAAEHSDFAAQYAWLDPIVGFRDEFVLGRWRLGMHTDVGGFNVSSDLAFWASASVEFMIAKWFSVWIGWQHYQVLFQRSTSTGATSLEFVLTGPSAGFGFHVF